MSTIDGNLNSRHLLDPDFAGLAALPPMPLDANSLAAARTLVAEMAGQAAAVSNPGVDRRDIHVDVDSGRRVRLLHFRVPQSTGRRPAMLHFHPGGFVLGSPEMSIEPIEEIVTALGCDVFSIDYPLAPEARFPEAFSAGMAALRWMHSNATDLGIDPARIALIGESAGGGLAASVGLGTRNSEGPPLCGLVLLFPMLDDRSAIGKPHSFAGEFVWTSDKNHFGWSALLGHAPGQEGVSPFAAPARAADLSGMPPTFISIGSIDLFIDDNIAFAQRLIRAGVPLELHIYPGAPHAFERIGEARATQSMKRDRIAAVARMFGSESPGAGDRA